MAGDKLLFKDRLVIPIILNLTKKILHEAHETPATGHGGFLKTLHQISSQFYCPRLKLRYANMYGTA